jgi:Domain of unknown function (DUF4184)
MPFTLAHPIVALPLWKLSQKRLNLLGLMVGTIVVRVIIGAISGNFVGMGLYAIGFWTMSFQQF